MNLDTKGLTMSQPMKKAKYVTVLGQNPEAMRRQKSVIVAVQLPRMGDYGMEWKSVAAIGREYAHFAHKLHPKAQPVNIQVYGDRKVIEGLARTGRSAMCELEMQVKVLEDGREYLLVNLFLTKPWLVPTHEFRITSAPAERPEWVYTTKNMNGIGIAVRPL